MSEPKQSEDRKGTLENETRNALADFVERIEKLAGEACCVAKRL